MKFSSIRKKAVGAAAVIAALSVSVSLGGCSSQNASTEKFKEYLDKEDYSEAAECLREHKDEINLDDLDGILKQCADSVKTSYEAGDCSYDKAMKDLDELVSMSDDGGSEYIRELIELVKSDESFREGERFFDEEQFAQAVENLGKVIESDPNYKAAQSMIEQAKGQGKIDDPDQLLENITSAVEGAASNIDTSSLSAYLEEQTSSLAAYLESNIDTSSLREYFEGNIDTSALNSAMESYGKEAYDAIMSGVGEYLRTGSASE